MEEVARESTALQQMGKTSLVITFDYELIVSCCTYVLHLEQGKVEAQYWLDDAGIERLQKFFLESG
jgi:ABC-type histidine transport system ATPase subunit